ncbi:hypothetical protein HWV07_09480 [Natronomonas salina]|uniref:hypothetical protein n=1 Tax=Natronomonas salina TaxID=1710540 RepID=UPI0015B777B2|nr:hypothetical protein [Natronomonas salina]QLD89248.1 hypothetical protein HWV07_09480 [Natronomonas salina]
MTTVESATTLLENPDVSPVLAVREPIGRFRDAPDPANASHAPFPLVALITGMASKLKRLGKLVYNVTSIITTVRLIRRLARKFRSSG